MHLRNPYRTPLDFQALAEFYPLLTPLLNYILWIQDIISSVEGKIRGLDIGTGASAIYPLLACSLPDNLHWSFVATEIDPLSIEYATRNINTNGLTSRITLFPVSADSGSILVPFFADLESGFDFTICNPPFYGSAEEIKRSAENKELPPNAVCTGAENEMITHGGEAEFVLRILRESLRDDIKNRCRWFTSMLGKLSSVEVVVSELRNLKIDNYALTQFVQGTTRRWAIAWSFGDERLPDKYARPISTSLVPFIPLPTTLRQRVTLDTNQIKIFLSQILSSINGLSFAFSDGNGSGSESETGTQPDDVHVQWSGTITAFENTWSRAARRRSKKRVHAQLEVNEDCPEDKNRNTEQVAASKKKRPVQSMDPEHSGHVSQEQGHVRCDILREAHPVPILDKDLNPKLYPSTAPSPSTSIVSKKEELRPILVCRIDAGILEPTTDSQPRYKIGKELRGPESTFLVAQWMRGADRAVFEGFWSHVCRKLKSFEE
ncbi:hypothetical protein Clacol_003479 [Clathrus columnatus]|uniref:U6 small nuclear RNA (adenine-(43)-N(6))-methyltransferase n=1 Tax=Clathrus columnatus TaxID=1419009 RepID=A0AAV5A3S4_9AGAM|nr:hypothetical protein Clacol_003479 [Clathrus columnatus]